MGTAERRLEILKYLSKARRATMPQLSAMFGVSIRTIQRDILEIEEIFRLPLRVIAGRYGGIFVIGDYRFDRAYMHEDELALLSKVQALVKKQLSDSENALLIHMIKSYTKTA